MYPLKRYFNMNNKLLIIKAITLLYRLTTLTDKLERPIQLLIDVTNAVKTPDMDLTVDRETRMMSQLKAITIEMIYASAEVSYSIHDLLQRIQIVCEPDPILFEAFRDNILLELSQEDIKKECINIISMFRRYFKEKECKEVINKYAAIAKFKPEEIGDLGKFIQQMMTDLEPYRVIGEEVKPYKISSINFDDTESVVNAFRDVQKAKMVGGSMFRTGLQKINTFLDGGIRRGETILIGALQHNNKSGFTRQLFRNVCMLNTPVVDTPGKKPAVVFNSLEDSAEVLFEKLYRVMREQETKQACTADMVRNTSPEMMAEYVIRKLRQTGWHVIIECFNPSDMTYLDLQNEILELEAKGYEVQAWFVDYLSLIPTKGCIQGPHGVDLRDLFRRMRNFTAAKKIAFITPHQLSTEAKMLVREDTMDFVKQIANGGYYSGSRQIDQEVDTEIMMHIEKFDMGSYVQSYMTFQRGKHRGGEIIPEKDKYCVYPFANIGELPDDVDGECRAVAKVGAVPKVDLGEEQAKTVTDNAFWL